jgi:hypothetical protein
VEEEVARQTHADGVNREQASSYQRFVLDFVLLLIVLARRGALRLSPSLETLAEKMLEYILFALAPSGDLPALGDADDGRGFMLSAGRVSAAHRDSLAVGSVLFQRPDFKFGAGGFGEEAFWLLGEEGLLAFEELEAEKPERTSVSFPQGGHYIIRDDWTPNSDYALFRCGEFGLAGEGYCAHSHCDLLSPVLWIRGRPLLVDSGTFTYHGPTRDLYRETAAHNTVIVDGEGQAIPAGPFSWQCVPTAGCEMWCSHQVAGRLVASNNVAIRRILSHPRSGVWQLIDQFEGEGNHKLEWAFHLATGIDAIPSVQGRMIRFVSDTEPEWIIDLQVPDVSFTVQDGWVSPSYGKRTPNKVVRARWHGKLNDIEGTRFFWQFSLADSKQGNGEA